MGNSGRFSLVDKIRTNNDELNNSWLMIRRDLKTNSNKIWNGEIETPFKEFKPSLNLLIHLINEQQTFGFKCESIENDRLLVRINSENHRFDYKIGKWTYIQ